MKLDKQSENKLSDCIFGVKNIFERIEYIATTYSWPECKDMEEPQFIKDEGLPALIPGSYASSSLGSTCHVFQIRHVHVFIPSGKGF